MSGTSDGLRPGGGVSLLVLTDRRQARRPLVEVVAAAVEGGARLVVLREKDLPAARRAALAAALRAVLAPAGGRLVVAGAEPLDGDAVHLPAAGPYPPPALPLVGRSCHDAAELARLSTEDYTTVSPVFPSASKPGYGPPLGLSGLAALVARTAVPVYALGGVESPERTAGCVAAGAAGVAVMGAVMRAADPARLVEQLCDAACGALGGAAYAVPAAQAGDSTGAATGAATGGATGGAAGGATGAATGGAAGAAGARVTARREP